MNWLIGSYAVLILILSATASAVALFIKDKARREMAYKVLKLVLGSASGAGG
jgi:hypothetical protein